ncbi:NRAMP family divalent metal transporter [Rhodopirellula halodulae]|uniref:NRAMP family divalent metal transporter n=1 Tax=Rhodopirellula halodulae TaxID=2894198 RepID=UPI001E4D9B14
MRTNESGWRRYRRIGPAIVVAAVVLGPGSIVSASRVACGEGFDLLWIVPLAGLLMIGMTAAAMTIGVCKERTLCGLVADRFGRWAAWLVGTALLIAITLFQASNNNAMWMAVMGFRGQDATAADSNLTRALGLLLFNGAIIALVWLGRRDLYRWIEKAMAFLVGAMVLSFGASMFASNPNWADVFSGLIPSLGSETAANLSQTDSIANQDDASIAWMSMAALVATTFSVAGAFYQSYQVKEKGWKRNNLKTGFLDVFVGISSLALITAMIYITAASALHEKIAPEELTDASVVALSLEPLFGSWARTVFSIGIFAGAASSFLVNALIGGVVFCDAIDVPCQVSSAPVRRATIVTLLAGWAVASVAALTGVDLVSFIVIAQSLTVLCFPLLGAVIVWQLHGLSRDEAGLPVRVLAWTGLIVVIALSIRTLSSLIARINEWL